MLRRYLRDWTFLTATVLSFGVGIGATAAGFAAIHSLLWSPYPYEGIDRMVAPYMQPGTRQASRLYLTTAQFREIIQAGSLQDGIIWDDFPMSRRIRGVLEVVNAAKVSPNAFDFLGIPPLVGQAFSGDYFSVSGDASHTAVLSYKYWQDHYSASSGVIGQNLELDHTDYTIIAVMPSRFRFSDADVYIPLTRPGGPYWTLLRIKPGAHPEAAQSEIESIFQSLARRAGDAHPGRYKIHLKSLREDALAGNGSLVVILFGATVLLFITGTVNASILILARVTTREREIQIRRALGASTSHLFRLLTNEALALTAGGGVFGLIFADVCTRVIVLTMPADLIPPDIAIRVSPFVAVITVILAFAAALIAGTFPMLHLNNRRYSMSGLIGSHGGVSDFGVRKSHRSMIFAQIIIVVTLLTGAAAAVRNYSDLTKTQLGYDPRNVVALVISLPDGPFSTWPLRSAYFDKLRSQLSEIPGVSAVAVSALGIQTLPPVNSMRTRFDIPGKSIGSDEQIGVEQVSADYFSTLRVPILTGRAWTNVEEMRPAHVALINRAMARLYWPNENPIGQLIKVGNLKKSNSFQVDSSDNDQRVEVIGVVNDVRNSGLRDLPRPAVYVPYTLLMWDSATLLVRTNLGASALASAARRRIAVANPDQPVYPISSLEERLKDAGWSREEFIATLITVFAVIALTLAALGLHSVVSYAVSERRRELAVRMALGGSPSNIVWVVTSSVGSSIIGGLLMGILLSAALNRTLSLWISYSPLSPRSLLPSLGILLGVSALAMLIPLTRSISTQAFELLRSD